LAADEYFLEHLRVDEFILYFYINNNAVIIGRNQNAWKECRVDKMEEDGVQLVRRITGGGAVYHDEGNLNFSFIANNASYDTEKQFTMILEAVRKLGIEAEFTGRNDLTVEGRKFSGNAFCYRSGKSMHHGTILVNTNLDRLTEYLSADPDKIRSKSIESVRSRVCNLNEYNSKLDVKTVLAAMIETYKEFYGEYSVYKPDEQAKQGIEKLYDKHRSWEWRLGETFPFNYETKARFDWGGIQLCLEVNEGIINSVQVFTDALDTALPQKVEEALTGVRFDNRDMADKLRQYCSERQINDLADYLCRRHTF